MNQLSSHTSVNRSCPKEQESENEDIFQVKKQCTQINYNVKRRKLFGKYFAVSLFRSTPIRVLILFYIKLVFFCRLIQTIYFEIYYKSSTLSKKFLSFKLSFDCEVKPLSYWSISYTILDATLRIVYKTLILLTVESVSFNRCKEHQRAGRLPNCRRWHLFYWFNNCIETFICFDWKLGFVWFKMHSFYCNKFGFPSVCIVGSEFQIY